jgi:hypothetical protein
MELNKPIFIALFEDNTNFSGGLDYFNTKWKELPNKKIRTLFYRLPFGDYLSLSGYEKYYHMVEATNDLNGENAGKVQIRNVYILGKKENKVYIYKINIEGNRIENTVLNENDRTVLELNPQGWK